MVCMWCNAAWSPKCDKSSVFHIRSNATLPSFRSPRSAPLIPLHECYRMLPCNTASGDDVQSLWIDKLAILLERGDAHDSAVVEDGKGNALLPDTHPGALHLLT